MHRCRWRAVSVLATERGVALTACGGGSSPAPAAMEPAGAPPLPLLPLLWLLWLLPCRWLGAHKRRITKEIGSCGCCGCCRAAGGAATLPLHPQRWARVHQRYRLAAAGVPRCRLRRTRLSLLAPTGTRQGSRPSRPLSPPVHRHYGLRGRAGQGALTLAILALQQDRHTWRGPFQTPCLDRPCMERWPGHRRPPHRHR